MEPHQLRALERAFMGWKDAAKRTDSVVGRVRMWLVFLLLRHTGARLGEVLSLDDRQCFEAEGSLVHLGKGERARAVPLPEEIFETVTRTLEGDGAQALRGGYFQVDPGYFRRICYARGRECGLSKEQVCPKGLRNSRAVEMLRSGVPITVVRDVLGQSSLELTAGFQQFSDGDMRSIVRTAQQTMRKRTSARNSFIGHVTEVKDDGLMAEVVLQTRAGVDVCAVITADSLRSLGLVQGSPVIATVKAPLVNVVLVPCAPGISGNPGNATMPGIRGTSARNRFRATISQVKRSPVIAEVQGRMDDGTELCALISGESASELGLSRGDEAEFWFKAFSVVINTLQL